MSGSGVYTLAPTGERIYEGQSAFGATPDIDDPDFEVKQPGHSMKKKEGEPPTIFDMLLQRQKETIRPLESYSLFVGPKGCLLYTSPSPRDQRGSRMPSSA